MTEDKKRNVLRIVPTEHGAARIACKIEFTLDKDDIVRIVADMLHTGDPVTPHTARGAIASRVNFLVGQYGTHFSEKISTPGAEVVDKAKTIVSFVIPELG